MLNVKLEKHDKAAILHLDGRIDANNAPELEQVFLDIAQRFDEVVLDFKKVPYISSAGLRAQDPASRHEGERGRSSHPERTAGCDGCFPCYGNSDVFQF